MPKNFIQILVYGLLVLIVFFAVVSAGMLVLRPTSGTTSYMILEGVASVALFLAITDAVLLLVGLGLQSLNSDD